MAQVIKIEISWCGKNYSCGWDGGSCGVVACTAKTVDDIKKEFEESLRFHVEGMLAGGEDLPGWLADGDYVIEYTLATSALLRQAERFTTMAAISRVTGISQKLLSHYANSVKVPSLLQRERIVDGLHTIGRQILAVC